MRPAHLTPIWGHDHSRTPDAGRLRALFGVLLLITTLVPVLVLQQPADAVQPQHVQLTFEGCRGSVGSFPEFGPFVCADDEYTTGNLGGGWNELDLVPHRLTTRLGTQTAATTTYDLRLTADHVSGAATGYDVLSVPVVNAAKSHASCSITAGAQQTTADSSLIYRQVQITQDKGSTCVFDWYQRLAIGASKYPGSSLHSHTRNETGGTQGVGNRDISIPVKQIQPQSIRKEMNATQGVGNFWSIEKGAEPARLDFDDTCDPAQRSATVDVEISWEKETRTGEITVQTKIYANNPSHRTITVDVEDKVYKGLGQASADIVDTASSGPVDVPANQTNFLIFTHTIQRPANEATAYNDVAVATYTDKVTGVPVPGTTQAVASAPVQTLGPTTNATAVISDVESISAGFKFRVLSVTGASGTFTPAYTPGANATLVSTLTWTSAPQSTSGSVTFAKQVVVDAPSSSSGQLSDTASLLGSDGFTDSFGPVNVALFADARVDLTINKALAQPVASAVTFTFEVYDATDQLVATRTITVPANTTAVQSATVTGLNPGTYTVKELANGLFAAQQQSTTITLPDCAGSVSFTNSLGPATARVRKVTEPSGSEAGWQFTLTGPGITIPEMVTTTGTGYVNFDSLLQVDGGVYTITEQVPPSGWDLTGIVGDFTLGLTTRAANTNVNNRTCSFTLNLLTDAGGLFSCTFTNTARGRVTVEKTEGGTAPGAGYTFQIRQGASTTSNGTVLASATTDSNGDADFSADLPDGLVPGTYQFCETGVLDGWHSSLSDMTGAFVPNSANDPFVDNSTICVPFELTAGQHRVFEVDNTPPPGGDARTIGYWRNWSSCTNGTQADSLGAALGSGIWIGDLKVDTCHKGVAILSKRKVSDNKNMANDAAYGLAAQLLAVELNLSGSNPLGGAGSCPALETARAQAHALLTSDLSAAPGVQRFDGTGDYLGPKVKGSWATLRQQATNLANTLDSYNNNNLCS